MLGMTDFVNEKIDLNTIIKKQSKNGKFLPYMRE